MTDNRDKDDRPGGASPGTEEDLLGPDLRALLSSLPRAIPPERDLTQEIAAQTWDSRERLPGAASLDAQATKHRRRPPPWWSGQGLKLAAAALALIVVTATVTMVLVQERVALPEDAPATVAQAAFRADPTALQADFAGYGDVERQYASAIADMTTALEANRDELPVETVRLIEENLQVIDEAIRRSLAALEKAPRSLSLQQAVMTSYERKLDFLRQAAAITAEG